METITYLVQNNSRGNVKFIKFTLSANRLDREWGEIGGKTQIKPSVYDSKNIGKANEKNPIQVALEDYNRIWKKKIKEGYVPAKSLTELPELKKVDLVMELDNIPTSFCLSKPIKDITPEIITQVLKTGNHRLFVKYNGGSHFISIGSTGEVKIFTRRWHNHTSKYPNIVKAYEAQEYLPNSLFAVELCCDPLLNIPHMTCLKHFQKCNKSGVSSGECKPDQSVTHDYQKRYPMKTAVFGILYYGGTELWSQPYGIMLKMIEKMVPLLSAEELLFQPQNVGLTTAAEILSTAKLNKNLIEGFVLWDTTQCMEVTMNGKPVRRAAWKVKIGGEKDVIAYDSEPTKNKDDGSIGAVKIGQYNADGIMVELGTVGGLKPTEGQDRPEFWDFPCVIEVGFANIFPETGKFQHGHFNKVHEDKVIEEVEIFDLATI